MDHRRHNAMTTMGTEHIREFRQFKAEYEERGKRIDNLETSTENIHTRLDEMNKNIKELLEIMNALSWGKKLLIGVLWFVGSIVAIGVGIKSIW